jgi:hypothetical protein
MYLALLIGLLYVLAWSAFVYRDLWVKRPILVDDPAFPGRHTRCVSIPVRRDAQGWRHHG